MAKKGEPLCMDIVEIQKCHRNRYPLLLIDKIEDGIAGEKVHAVKNFTYNEWFFPAHFDDEPNVPGSIQTECLAQAFAMTFLSLDEYMGKKTAFVKENNIKFKRKIVPGDRLDIYATLESFIRGIGKGHVESYVNREIACSGDMVICIPDEINKYKPK